MIMTKLKFTGTDTEIRDQVITHVIERLAYAHTFGYFTKRDIVQHCWVIALEVLNTDGYDISLPLEKFLYTHLRNRLRNLYRDKCWRKMRPNENPDSWRLRVRRKSSLMNVAETTDDKYSDCEMLNEVAASDLSNFIQSNLPEQYRDDYHRLLNNESLVNISKKEIRELIQEIIIYAS